MSDAPNTQDPRAAAQAIDSKLHSTARYSPHRPGIRPDGMGRVGSLIASTLRSNQSLTAWLVAHSKGPHSVTPARIAGQRRCQTAPSDTTPQQKAHIGGNQVMGLSSSSTTDAAGTSEVRAVEAGRDIGVPLLGLLEMLAFSRGELPQSVAAQFCIQALPAEAEYFRG